MPPLDEGITAAIRRTVSATIDLLRARNPGRDIEPVVHTLYKDAPSADWQSSRFMVYFSKGCDIPPMCVYPATLETDVDWIDISTVEDVAAGKRTFTSQEWEYHYIDRIKYATGDTFKRWLVTCPICNVGDVHHSDGHSTCPVCVPTSAATGPTQRLTRVCAACGDELPTDAVFCIVCGASVEERK